MSILLEIIPIITEKNCVSIKNFTKMIFIIFQIQSMFLESNYPLFATWGMYLDNSSLYTMLASKWPKIPELVGIIIFQRCFLPSFKCLVIKTTSNNSINRLLMFLTPFFSKWQSASVPAVILVCFGVGFPLWPLTAETEPRAHDHRIWRLHEIPKR